MTTENKQEIAKMLFEAKSCSEQEMALKLDIPLDTLHTWKKAGQWGNKTETQITESDARLRAFYEQLDNLNAKIKNGKGYPTDKESMTQRRLAASIGYLEEETTLGNVIKVGREFNDWANKEDRSKALSVLQIYDKFVVYKSKGAYKSRLEDMHEHAIKNGHITSFTTQGESL